MLEEVVGIVVGLGLDVLREGERHGSGLGLVDEDSHRAERGRHHLLRAHDPVEVTGDRRERIVDGDVAAPGDLELLQDGIRPARREDVTRQQENGQPVDRRERSPGDEVRRSGTDRGRARKRGEPVLHPREPDRRMHHRLLVPCLVVGEEIGVLVERLADSGDVAVAEDPEAALEEAVLDTVALDVLRGEEANEGLGGGDSRHRQELSQTGGGYGYRHAPHRRDRSSRRRARRR